MRLTLRILFLLLGWTAVKPNQKVWAQSVCATPGKDGTVFTTSPNTYYPGVGTAAANATTISVGTPRTSADVGASATPISIGDLLLVIQMQGANINSANSDSYGDGVAGGGASGNLTTGLTAGQYEYVVAASAISGGSVTISTGLKNAYVTSAGNTTTTLRTFQVIRVPQYSSLAMTANIVPPFWNGSTGGIIALDVQGQLNFGTAVINASGLGFRGGAGVRQVYNVANPVTQYVTAGPPDLTAAATNLNAQKGEGIAGTPRFVNILGTTIATNTGVDGYPGGSSSRGAPGNAGGGANDNGNNSGGGGGGNAGPGGRGGLTSNNIAYGGEPGAAFASSPSVLIMGGGGGGGTTNDGSGAGGAGFASSGAPGGGIVIVRTGTVGGSGGIVVDGGNAPSGVVNDGAGGGGAGGSILLTATTSQTGLASLTLSAKGGAGGTTRPVDAGNGSTAHGPGGGGGGGVIFSTGPAQNTLVASTVGGVAGTSTPGSTTVGSATSTFGAAAGSNASAANGSTSTSNTITNSSAGAVCAPIVTNVSPVCANAGKDGATFTATPNSYYPGVGTAAINATTLTVGAIRTGTGASATPISIGDLLLVIQMQGADINTSNNDAYGDGVAGGAASGTLATNRTAGQYEYVVVSGVSGTTITFSTGLKNTYVTSAGNTTTTLRTFQVVRVPQYSSLTLTGNIVPAAWNGATGGIVALDVAGALNLNGNTIDASGLGFRGGAGRVLTTSNFDDAAYLTTVASGFNGQKGEGLAGTPQFVNNGGALLNTNVDGYPGGSSSRGAPGNAGGGGNDNLNNSGGGGGANGGPGGRGGNNFINNKTIGGEPGAAFAATGTSLVLGGGGGAGSTNDGSGGNAGLASSGSAGGGIVVVRAGSVAGTGTVLANAAATLTGVLNDGAGGGGAGGSILITAITPSGLNGLTLRANGAAGGNTNPSAAATPQSQHGPGGGGGGGSIFTNGTVASATATGGASGITTYTANGTTATETFGASVGTNGQISTNATTGTGNGAGVVAGANCTSLTGTIFDDSNYGGGSGRSLSTATSSASASGLSSIGSVGTTVELYSSTGTLVATTTTTAGGAYTFSGLTAGAGYTVRVVNSTVKAARTPGATGVVPVQTFRTTAYTGTGLGAAASDINRVGGEAPEKQDAAANSGSQTLAALTAGTATAQSITTIVAGTSGVDFGFNFDVVTNTNNTGQGSLAQFITNANALGNENLLAQSGSNSAGTLAANRETSIFMIPSGAAVAGQVAGLTSGLTNGVAAINVTTMLPTIMSSNISIDGTTQTFNIGNTNNALLGAGGTVGTGGAALGQLNGPEVQLKGTQTINGITMATASNNTTVRGLSIYGFNTAVFGGVNNTGTRIEQNVIGASATSFADPTGTNRNLNEGINLNDSDNGFVTNNLIGFNGGMGIWVQTSGAAGSNGSNNNSITGNEVRGNALTTIAGGGERLVFDGVELQGTSTGNTVAGNLITANYGHGIDSFGNDIGGNTISGNTISDNGVGVLSGTGEEGSGLRVFGANNPTLIANNVLTGNNGSGVLVLGTARQVRISQNSTSGNTRLGIDLLSTAEGTAGTGTVFWNGQTGANSNLTLNDSGDTDTGGNGLLNTPIIQSAVVGANGVVTVTGFARPNTLVELFLAAADPTNFGEGTTYLTSFTQGSAAGTVGSVVTGAVAPYSGVLNNGLNQGADNTNTFTYTFTPTAAQLTLLRASSALLTSTATLTTADANNNVGTSEFSGNARVQQTPVPNDVTNASVANNQVTPVVLNPNLSAAAVGNTANVTTNTANTVASYVVNPIASAQGTLFYNGSAVTGATTVPVANLGQLTFVPTRGFVGNATFAYTAIDANGLASTTHNTAGTVTNGPATYTIPVTPSSDVTASLSGGTTLSPGQPTGYYTATFTNLGPNVANDVAQVVTLPTGASLSTAQQNALPTNTTVTTTGSGTSAVTTITFPPAVSLGSGLSNSFRFAFTASTTAGGSTLAASTSTSSSEGADVAANSASLALTTVGVVDLQAAITAASGTISPGNTATFTTTFTNNSTPTAAGVVPTVQLIPGLTAGTLTVGGQTGTANATTITFANGAVYTIATGQITYATTTLATGSVSSIITFTMPASGVVTATASLTSTTTESNPTNNVDSASIVAGPRFDLATTISGPTTVVAGSPVTLSVTTTNNGPQAVAGAVETVQLPAGLNPTIGPPGVFISNGGTYDNASGVVTFPALGSLPSGQTVAHTITFLAPAAAFTPSAQVAPNTANAGDTNLANNTAYLNGAASSTAPGATLTPTAATATVANLTATLTTTSTIVSAATQVTYTVGASNAGPGAATSVTGQLQLLPGLNATTLLVAGLSGTLQADNVTYAFADGTAYKSVSYNSQTGLLSYAATATSLASGASFSFPVAVTVPATVGNEGQLLATNSVGSATSDNVPADNVKAATVTVRPTSDLVATLTGPTSGVVPGQSVTYTATFTNNGPNAARVVAETVQLPSGLTASTLTVGGQTGTLVNATTLSFANGAVYNPATGLVTLPALASDAVGAVQAFNLTFVAPAQSYVVSSAISSATPDATPANNAASVATAVTPTTDVAVALAGPATAVIGNYVTYTLTTTNNGTGTATNVVPTLRLPAGLTIQSAPVGYTYDNTGLLTFPALSTLQAGVSAENYVTFTMPNAPGGQLSGLASVSSATQDNVLTNNTAAITTGVAPATTTTPAAAATTADLLTSITPTGTSVAPGSTVTYTATYRNSGTQAATNVVPTVSLPTGLSAADLRVGGVAGTLSNGLITFGSGPAVGATYDVATGLLTFPTIASLPFSASATSYSVAFSAPTSGQLVVVSAVSSNTTDLNPADNRNNSSITINPAFDLTTSISGPASALAGSQNVYTIKTTNNGPSSVSSATQTVQLPTGLTTSTLLVAGQTGTLSGTTISYPSSGASYDTGSGLLTFAAISNLAPGLNGVVSNTITVTMPNTGSLTVGDATVSTTAAGESNTNNNTFAFTTITAPLSLAPVAQNMVNSLRSPEGNTANALAISPLFATDPDGNISNYFIQSLPTSGTLYYNGAAITSITGGGYQVPNPALLSFDPANTFAGNVFFTYTATDNNGVVSNTALYTIPVAQDLASAYTAYNTTKGGANKYVTNDVLAQVIDPNKAVYTSAGTIFDGTGALQAGAANGLLTSGTNAVLATTGPAGNPGNTLPAGVSLDPATGRIFVSNASQLVNNPTAQNYSVFVITTDANGGISQALATFTLGAYPLPVVLTDFTALAVRNRDAFLTWATASEKNNDHFDIERSFDGATFAKIAAVAGHGTTTAASSYALTDAGVAALANGPVYYRLRQVDRDGTSSFSPVRSVRFSTEVAAAPLALSLFPNPAQATTQLDLRQLPASGTYQVLLLDATGRTVRTATLAGGLPQPLDVQQLATGTYHVRVSGQLADGTSFQQTLRLTKE